VESYRTDEEQLEALKRWWDENGRSTITAVIFALAVGFGWQGWQQYREDQSAEASNAYQNMSQLFSRQDTEAASKAAEQLKADASGSTYAQFAALHLARAAVEAGDLAAAEAQLRWVGEHADKDSEAYRVSRLRLARVLADSDPAAALAILDATDPGSFQASYQAARGDFQLLQGNTDAARESYGSALMLAARGGEPVNTALLQEKLNSLNPTLPQPLDSQPEPAAVDLAPAAGEATDSTGAEES